ncbi:MAG: hypothetical protein R2741_07210 [Methanolobus sp.]
MNTSGNLHQFRVRKLLQESDKGFFICSQFKNIVNSDVIWTILVQHPEYPEAEPLYDDLFPHP